MAVDKVFGAGVARQHSGGAALREVGDVGGGGDFGVLWSWILLVPGWPACSAHTDTTNCIYPVNGVTNQPLFAADPAAMGCMLGAHRARLRDGCGFVKA
jgi:hypothetical protein